MLKDDIIQSVTNKDKNNKKSKIPAKLDFIQGATGLILVGFIIFHLIFESSINTLLR
jgi:fumarate reductase subunit C